MSESINMSCSIHGWRDVSLAQAEALLEVSHDLHTLQMELQPIIERKSKNSVAMATKLEVELYSHAVVFSSELGLSPEQLSALLSIVRDVHSVCIASPHDNTLEAVKLFQDLMVCHSVHHPPYCTSLFSLSQVKSITDYILSTYFKHYKLYKFAFTKHLRLEVCVGGDDGEASPGESTAESGSQPCEVGESEPPSFKPCTVDDGVENESHSSIPDSRVESEPPSFQLIIESALAEKMKQLKASVEGELRETADRMAARLTALEKGTNTKTLQTK